MAVNQRAVEAALPVDADVVIDTAPIIAYLEGGQPITPVAELLIDDFIRPGRNGGIVCAISVTELFVGVERAGRGDAELLDFLHRFPNLRCVDVDFGLARRAAGLRARTGLKVPDALIISTAAYHAAGAIATNDDDWTKKCPELRILTLSKFVV